MQKFDFTVLIEAENRHEAREVLLSMFDIMKSTARAIKKEIDLCPTV